MSTPTIKRRVFVVGVPRSGTTLVQSLLAAHDQIISFTESHFWSRHFKMIPGSSRGVLVHDPTPRLHAFLVENGVDSSQINCRLASSGVARPLLPPRTQRVAGQLISVLDAVAQEQGASTWVEKTPRHLRYLPFLERLNLDHNLHFVHVVRQGLETVASLHKASQNWQRPYDLEACVARWNQDVAFSLSRISSPRDQFVFYEELTAEPEVTMRRVFKQLGLPWQPEILERYGEAGKRLITGAETWKANVDGPVRTSATSERVLTRAERQHVQANLRHNLYEQIRQRLSP